MGVGAEQRGWGSRIWSAGWAGRACDRERDVGGVGGTLPGTVPSTAAPPLALGGRGCFLPPHPYPLWVGLRELGTASIPGVFPSVGDQPWQTPVCCGWPVARLSPCMHDPWWLPPLTSRPVGQRLRFPLFGGLDSRCAWDAGGLGGRILPREQMDQSFPRFF